MEITKRQEDLIKRFVISQLVDNTARFTQGVLANNLTERDGQDVTENWKRHEESLKREEEKALKELKTILNMKI